MKTIIKDPKASFVNYNNRFIELNKEIDLSFSDTMRLSRRFIVETQYNFVPHDPSLFKDRKFFNFMGDIDLQSGFGNVSYNLLKYSKEYEIAYLGKTSGLVDGYISRLNSRDLNQAGVMIWHDQPRLDWVTTPFQKNIAIIPWETTKIPQSWVKRINTFDALFTPCKQNIEDFKANGIKIPIELIHWGVDPQKFYEIERPQRPTFVFGHLGALTDRKGTDILIRAFLEAFPKHITDVELICKTSFYGFPYAVHDKRVKIIISPQDHSDLMQTYKSFDCFVFPTRGEGFGLTPLEAMATGIPAIVTGWSGPMEYMNDEVGWILKHSMIPATVFSEKTYKEDCGDWAEPDFNHLVELMKYAYNNREIVKQKGKKAAEYVRNNWLWEHKISMFHEALKKHL